MTLSSPRPVLAVSSEWPLPLLQENFAAAIEGGGPALAFGAISTRQVPAECAILVPTSGSSGFVKEVALSASALLSSARASLAYLAGAPGDKWSLQLPLTHIAAANVLARAYCAESELAPIQRAHFTAIVPAQLHKLIDDGAIGEATVEDWRNLKAILVGGQATPMELLQRGREFGLKLVTTYGMSEMSGGCVYDGHPLSGVEVEIDGEGRICLAGPMQALGYQNAAKEWQLSKRHQWFVTNDLGTFAGGKLTIQGRRDAIIKSGGEQIDLDLVEAILNSGSGHEYGAIGLPDPKWGSKLVIAHTGEINASMQESLNQLLREKIGAHAAAKEFFRLESIERGAMGKSNRSLITAQILRKISKGE